MDSKELEQYYDLAWSDTRMDSDNGLDKNVL